MADAELLLLAALTPTGVPVAAPGAAFLAPPNPSPPNTGDMAAEIEDRTDPCLGGMGGDLIAERAETADMARSKEAVDASGTRIDGRGESDGVGDRAEDVAKDGIEARGGFGGCGGLVLAAPAPAPAPAPAALEESVLCLGGDGPEEDNADAGVDAADNTLPSTAIVSRRS